MKENRLRGRCEVGRDEGAIAIRVSDDAGMEGSKLFMDKGAAAIVPDAFPSDLASVRTTYKVRDNDPLDIDVSNEVTPQGTK